MAASVEVKKWVEGRGEIAKVAIITPDDGGVEVSSNGSGGGVSPTANESVGTGEPALSVISDTLSEEYSSDSGKGGSDTTVTPPDSISGTEAAVAQLQLAYNSSYMAYSKSYAAVMPKQPMIFEFEIAQQIVGRLIGRHGIYVHKVKGTTGANIIIKRHPTCTRNKICAVEGTAEEVEEAIKMIRERFPIKRYSSLTMEQTNSQEMALPPMTQYPLIANNRINLIEGVINDVTVSCVVDLEHIFLQQPTHPSFPALTRLHESMNALYQTPNVAPLLTRPFSSGVLCVTKIGESDWVRAEVRIIHKEKDLATARLVDVGGYVQVPIDELRQIRVEYVHFPFQATECRLANIAPVNEKEGWSEEAINFFRIICQGQVLQAHVVGYCIRDKQETTLINLYKPNGYANHLLINEQMVTHNYARWIDELSDQQYFYTDGTSAYSGEINQQSQNEEWVNLSSDQCTLIPTEDSVITDDTLQATTDATETGKAKAEQEPAEDTPKILSWAEEMSRHDEEEYGNPQDLTETGEDENARRKNRSN